MVTWCLVIFKDASLIGDFTHSRNVMETTPHGHDGLLYCFSGDDIGLS